MSGGRDRGGHSPSIKFSNPHNKAGWSSTSKTVILSWAMRLLQRETEQYQGTVAGFAADAEFAVEMQRALIHAGDAPGVAAEAPFVGDALAVIFDFDLDLTPVARDPDRDARRAVLVSASCTMRNKAVLRSGSRSVATC